MQYSPVRGRPLAADPIVFLPGVCADARLFRHQIADLGREVPVCVWPTSGFERIEEVASELLVNAPRRFALAGHGYGGMVAMEVLRRAPDRVTRLALMDTSPLGETPQEAAMREPKIVRARAGRMAEVVRDEVPESSLAAATREAVYAELEEMAEAQGADAYVRQVRGLQRRGDQQALLRRCKLPVLILCGREDTVHPLRRHEFLSDLIPYARLRIIENAGHVPMLEQPDQVTTALRQWLCQPVVLREALPVTG